MLAVGERDSVLCYKHLTLNSESALEHNQMAHERVKYACKE